MLRGADVFVGLSQANCVSQAMVRSMAESPIIFAMANPDPEITYEAATEAILYEFDRDFRMRERQRRIEMDPSFGAALRRLRIQKGVPRSGFPGISEKEVARIERGEVSRPHAATLRVIADRLGVAPAEIETF
jgi:hypothetical protein